MPVDFWLFQADVEHPVFTEAPPAPTVVPAATTTAEGALLGVSGTVLEWPDWHVAVTCVEHCDQQ
jgi:hypothetical protein